MPKCIQKLEFHFENIDFGFFTAIQHTLSWFYLSSTTHPNDQSVHSRCLWSRRSCIGLGESWWPGATWWTAWTRWMRGRGRLKYFTSRSASSPHLTPSSCLLKLLSPYILPSPGPAPLTFRTHSGCIRANCRPVLFQV